VLETYVAVILLSFMSLFTTAAGVALALHLRHSDRGIAVGIGFSAGIMLLISFFELIPEAAAVAGVLRALVAVGMGGLLLIALNFVIPHIHLEDERRDRGAPLARTAYLVVLGLILHDFPEGFAMANSYIASPSLGLLVAVAIALHNLPEEFAMAVPAVLSERKRFLYAAAAISALAEPAGAIIGLIAVSIVPTLNPLFMAFAAGAMIFVSLHELVPMARRCGHLLLFTAGMALSGAVFVVLRALI
jgi:ZIP family zinc transporter